MDIIFIRGLKIETIIGIEEWEKQNPQEIHIDLEMRHNISRAAASDNIEDALDYKAVTDRIVDYVNQNRFELIESLAENIATLVRLEFRVDWLRLTLGKPQAIEAADSVGLIIERGNKT
jgi:dihydroneopterin aldolase